jgi:uncharacterized protein YjeT (DUF2065 family)
MRLDQVLAGLAVVLAIEGLLYATMPGAMRRLVAALAEQPESRLRGAGLVAAVVGVVVAWLLTVA